MAINFLSDSLLKDDVKLNFGNSSDLQIYHDGSHSFISDQGSGNLTVLASAFVVNNASDTENMIIASADGSVNLYYNGSKKFETKSDGVDITGELQADSLDIDGTANISGNTTIGSSSNTSTYLDIVATNTAGAPAQAACLRYNGYESRATGSFNFDTGQTNKAWFNGVPYNGGFTYQIGFSSSGSQSEYTANGLFGLSQAGQIQFHKYGASTFSGTVTTFPAFTGSGLIVDRTPAQVRSDIGAGTSSTTGTVTSVGFSHAGNAFTTDGVPVTSNGTIAITMAGSSSQYINGAGNLTSFPSIPAAGVTSVAQTHTGNAFDISGSPITGSGTLAIDVVGTSAQYITGEGNLATTITNNNSLTNGAGYTTNTGTTTAGNTQTFTNKSGNISQWTNNSGYTTNVGDITGVTAGTGMSGGGTSGSVTLNCTITNNSQLTNGAGYTTNTGTTTAGNTQTFTNKSGNISQWTNDSGYLTSAGSMSSWSLTADSGGTETITNGEGVDIAGGTNITTARSGATVTITNGITNNNQLTNGAGYTTNTGDITGVTAGSGLTGGGTSGGVTVSVDYTSAGLIADCPSGTGSISENDFIMIGQDESSSGETRSFEIQELPFLSSSTTGVNDWTVFSTLNVRGVIDLADNDILRFGTGDDVEMYFSGSDMFMDINNGEDFKIRDGNSGNATRFTFDADSGDFTATGNVSAYSDIRLKDNIKTLDGSKVLEMRGVSYTKDGKESSGVIAQELEKVAPELVMTHENEDGIKSVAYGNLVGYLIEAVKEQQKQIDELKIKLSDISK